MSRFRSKFCRRDAWGAEELSGPTLETFPPKAQSDQSEAASNICLQLHVWDCFIVVLFLTAAVIRNENGDSGKLF